MKNPGNTINSYCLPILISFFTLLSSQVVAQQEPILVPLTDVSTNKLPYIVAKEEGLFDKYGISIELYMTPGAALKGGGDGMTPNPEYIDDPDTDRLLSTGGGVGQIHRRVTEGGDRVILGTTGNILTWWL
jgi:hypothetical protein